VLVDCWSDVDRLLWQEPVKEPVEPVLDDEDYQVP